MYMYCTYIRTEPVYITRTGTVSTVLGGHQKLSNTLQILLSSFYKHIFSTAICCNLSSIPVITQTRVSCPQVHLVVIRMMA